MCLFQLLIRLRCHPSLEKCRPHHRVVVLVAPPDTPGGSGRAGRAVIVVGLPEDPTHGGGTCARPCVHGSARCAFSSSTSSSPPFHFILPLRMLHTAPPRDSPTLATPAAAPSAARVKDDTHIVPLAATKRSANATDHLARVQQPPGLVRLAPHIPCPFNRYQ